MISRFVTITGLLAGISALGLGCGIPKDEHQKVKDFNAKLRADLKKSQDAKEAMKKKAMGLADELAKVKAALRKAEGDASSCAGKVKGLEAALAKAKMSEKELAKIKAKMKAQAALNKKLTKSFRAFRWEVAEKRQDK